jgi:uncharacterized protein DUF1176
MEPGKDKESASRFGLYFPHAPSPRPDRRRILGASAASAELKNFRDWIAACDNTRTCAAYAVKQYGRAFLRIERAGAPAAAPRITVFVDVEKGKRFTLAFDDAAAGGLPQGAIAAAPGDDDLTKVEIAAVDAFVAALRKATRIDVRIDPPADEQPEISLAGASAALLWIDEQQKRLGTVTALVRRGEKPASGVEHWPVLYRATRR